MLNRKRKNIMTFMMYASDKQNQAIQPLPINTDNFYFGGSGIVLNPLNNGNSLLYPITNHDPSIPSHNVVFPFTLNITTTNATNNLLLVFTDVYLDSFFGNLNVVPVPMQSSYYNIALALYMSTNCQYVAILDLSSGYLYNNTFSTRFTNPMNVSNISYMFNYGSGINSFSNTDLTLTYFNSANTSPFPILNLRIEQGSDLSFEFQATASIFANAQYFSMIGAIGNANGSITCTVNNNNIGTINTWQSLNGFDFNLNFNNLYNNPIYYNYYGIQQPIIIGTTFRILNLPSNTTKFYLILSTEQFSINSVNTSWYYDSTALDLPFIFNTLGSGINQTIAMFGVDGSGTSMNGIYYTSPSSHSAFTCLTTSDYLLNKDDITNVLSLIVDSQVYPIGNTNSTLLYLIAYAAAQTLNVEIVQHGSQPSAGEITDLYPGGQTASLETDQIAGKMVLYNLNNSTQNNNVNFPLTMTLTATNTSIVPIFVFTDQPLIQDYSFININSVADFSVISTAITSSTTTTKIGILDLFTGILYTNSNNGSFTASAFGPLLNQYIDNLTFTFYLNDNLTNWNIRVQDQPLVGSGYMSFEYPQSNFGALQYFSGIGLFSFTTNEEFTITIVPSVSTRNTWESINPYSFQTSAIASPNLAFGILSVNSLNTWDFKSPLTLSNSIGYQLSGIGSIVSPNPLYVIVTQSGFNYLSLQESWFEIPNVIITNLFLNVSDILCVVSLTSTGGLVYISASQSNSFVYTPSSIFQFFNSDGILIFGCDNNLFPLANLNPANLSEVFIALTSVSNTLTIGITQTTVPSSDISNFHPGSPVTILIPSILGQFTLYALNGPLTNQLVLPLTFSFTTTNTNMNYIMVFTDQLLSQNVEFDSTSGITTSNLQPISNSIFSDNTNINYLAILNLSTGFLYQSTRSLQTLVPSTFGAVLTPYTAGTTISIDWFFSNPTATLPSVIAWNIRVQNINSGTAAMTFEFPQSSGLYNYFSGMGPLADLSASSVTISCALSTISVNDTWEYLTQYSPSINFSALIANATSYNWYDLKSPYNSSTGTNLGFTLSTNVITNGNFVYLVFTSSGLQFVSSQFSWFSSTMNYINVIFMIPDILFAVQFGQIISGSGPAVLYLSPSSTLDFTFTAASIYQVTTNSFTQELVFICDNEEMGLGLTSIQYLYITAVTTLQTLTVSLTQTAAPVVPNDVSNLYPGNAANPQATLIIPDSINEFNMSTLQNVIALPVALDVLSSTNVNGNFFNFRYTITDFHECANEPRQISSIR